jgi:hypothetical protein
VASFRFENAALRSNGDSGYGQLFTDARCDKQIGWRPGAEGVRDSASARARRQPALDSSADLLLHRGMSNPPHLSPRKQAERAARDKRLARALRDNLRRRKGQTRAQNDPAGGNADTSTTLSGELLSGKSNRHGGTTADC